MPIHDGEPMVASGGCVLGFRLPSEEAKRWEQPLAHLN